MFSFDGDFRRRPIQNFGGSSQKSDRNTIIKNAQFERQRREQIRKETSSATKIQSHVRSFVYRLRCKNAERANFDDHIKVFGIRHEEDFEYLLKRIIFFYDFNIDGDRLINLCQYIMKHTGNLYQKVKEVTWCHRLKRLLNCCMNQIFSQNHSPAIPLRMLEVFTTSDNVIKYIQNPYTVQQYLESVFSYMIQQEYFPKIRRLIQERVPVLDEEDNYSSQIGEEILQMVLRPLRLIDMASEDLNNIILKSFISTFLSKEFTEQIKYFIIPQLAKQDDFPFVPLINYIAAMYQRHIDYQNTILIDIGCGQRKNVEYEQFTTFLLYSILKVDGLIAKHSSNMEVVRNYIKVLASVIDNVKKLPRPHTSNWHATKHYEDSDSDESDQEADYPMYSDMEMRTLLAVLGLLNEVPRVIFLVQRVDLFLNEPEILSNLCDLCHALMTSNKNAVYECK